MRSVMRVLEAQNNKKRLTVNASYHMKYQIDIGGITKKMLRNADIPNIMAITPTSIIYFSVDSNKKVSDSEKSSIL